MKVSVSPHALSRYRERFRGAAEEELVALYRRSEPAPSRIRKQVDLGTNLNRVVVLADTTVMIVAEYLTEVVIVTAVPLDWYARDRAAVKVRVRAKRYN